MLPAWELEQQTRQRGSIMLWESTRVLENAEYAIESAKTLTPMVSTLDWHC